VSIPLDTSMVIASPQWSMMAEEGEKLLGYLRVVVDGQLLLPEQHEEFFSELPKRLVVTCQSVGRRNLAAACLEAINLLHVRSKKWPQPELSFVDQELVGALEQVLTKTASGFGIKDAIIGTAIRPPRFTIEATPDLPDELTRKNLAATMAANAMTDMVADINRIAKWTIT